MHLLKTPRNLFNEKTLKLIYHVHIQSHIDYGLVLWGTMTTKDNLNRMQSIQSIQINELIKLQEIKIGYRLLNKLLPNKISQQLQCDSNHKSLIKAHPYNTRRKNIPNLPKVVRMNYINSYLYQSIKQFMLLPLNLQNMPSISSFIANYKRIYWT